MHLSGFDLNESDYDGRTVNTKTCEITFSSTLTLNPICRHFMWPLPRVILNVLNSCSRLGRSRLMLLTGMIINSYLTRSCMIC